MEGRGVKKIHQVQVGSDRLENWARGVAMGASIVSEGPCSQARGAKDGCLASCAVVGVSGAREG
jgi:hypothetical protein